MTNAKKCDILWAMIEKVFCKECGQETAMENELGYCPMCWWFMDEFKAFLINKKYNKDNNKKEEMTSEGGL